LIVFDDKDIHVVKIRESWEWGWWIALMVSPPF